MKTLKSFTPGYWTCQLLGWGLIGQLNILYSSSFSGQNEESTHAELIRLAVWVVSGLFLSHLMRDVIRKCNLIEMSPLIQTLWILSLTLLFSLLSAAVSASIILTLVAFHTAQMDASLIKSLNIRTALSSLVILLVWNSIYFLSHYVAKTRRQETDKIRMTQAMRELELKRIKANMNPHFVFNAINGIRALVDEQPNRARDAMTSLGNILRSSLLIEKHDIVSLREELAIVQDYLALQKIRFEERLEVETDIDPNTLDLSIPTMMMQTLVENAVKHGVCSNTRPGRVRISAQRQNGRFTIWIQNPGMLGTSIGITGVGLKSTRERLAFLFGEEASLVIRQSSEDTVEVRVVIPIRPLTSRPQRSRLDFELNRA